MFNQAMQRQNQIAELMSKQAAGVCVLGGGEATTSLQTDMMPDLEML